MQVRPDRPSGISDPTDLLAGRDVVASLDRHAPRLHMSVERKSSSTDVDHDRIAAGQFLADSCEAARNLSWLVIACADDRPIGHRVDRLPVVNVAVYLVTWAGDH